MFEVNPVPVMCNRCGKVYSLGEYYMCPNCGVCGSTATSVSLETLEDEQVESDLQHALDSVESLLKNSSPREELGAWGQQIGGDHYKSMKIQPAEYNQANGLDWLSANIVKYASRHKHKGGREDVLKIIHYAELLLEMEYEDS